MWLYSLRKTTLARCFWLLSGIVSLLLPLAACAGSQAWTLDRYQHVAWTSKDGAPTAVSGVAQSLDGYLWISASHGLYRFDGSRFQYVDVPGSLTIDGIFASSDGSLWMRHIVGGISFLKDGRTTTFGAGRGLPADFRSLGFLEDSRGLIWTYGTEGFYAYTGKDWVHVDDDPGLKDGWGTYLLIASNGTYWAGTRKGLYYRPAHARQFVPLEQEGYVARTAEAPDGSIWVAHFRGTIERWTVTNQVPTRAPGSIPTQAMGEMRFDHQGGLWINGLEGTVRHLAPDAIVRRMDLSSLNANIETFTKADGLTGGMTWPLLVDREGNIWAGTGGGIDRFSRSNFALAPFPPATRSFALVAGADGSIWTGSGSMPLMRLAGRDLMTLDIAPITSAAYRDPQGVIYIGSSYGIWEIDGVIPKHLTNLPTKPELTDFGVQAITKDLHGVLWVSIQPDGGLYTWFEGRWSKSSIEGTPHTEFTDASGRIWLGYPDNRITTVDGASVRTIGIQQGLAVGDVAAFQQDGNHVWVGGSNGLGYMDGQRWKAVTLIGAGRLDNVTGIVFSTQQDLWVQTLDAVYHMPAIDVQRAINDPGYAMHFRKFDSSDGLPGGPAYSNPRPSSVKGTDGRIWFATSNGVVWLDPTQVIFNALPPPVIIESIEANGNVYAPSDGLALPANTRDVQIRFSVPSLTMPQRLDAKVRMSGLNNDWRNVGLQREITYANLGPGTRRFDVIAANEDGVWNKVGASLQFSITPAFYQTRWFMVLCICLGLFLLWLAFMWRLHQLHRRLRTELEVRNAERERIARDLHDTLLQNLYASLLMLQGSVDGIASASDRAAVNQKLGKARAAAVEGRDKISQLRMQQSGNLAEILSNFAAEQQEKFPLSITLSVEGGPRPLRDDALEEVTFIAREAIWNACKHANAKTIQATIDYRPDGLAIDVQDDGRGMDLAHLAGMEKSGHWGVAGMKERARQLSARLTIHSQPGNGLTVNLWVPARRAYLQRRMFGALLDRFFFKNRE